MSAPLDAIKTIFIISDGTGETAAALVKAALVQFPSFSVNIVRLKNIRTESQLEPAFEQIKEQNGFVVHTIVSPSLQNKIKETAAENGIPCVDLLGPILGALNLFFGTSSSEGKAGALRSVDERYFKRIEAIEFTVKYDDGKILDSLEKADIVLVGISRTSKTPLSIFLSHKGWKVANVPLVLDQKVPEELLKIDQRKVVGLIIDGESLYRIRKKRLEKMGQTPKQEYANMAYILKEIEYANNLFKKNKRWPVFDVTDRALEETAAEIIKVIVSRMNMSGDFNL
jgi:regulator of PEP synthase PpsR (kinase-PPPase family)